MMLISPSCIDRVRSRARPSSIAARSTTDAIRARARPRRCVASSRRLARARARGRRSTRSRSRLPRPLARSRRRRVPTARLARLVRARASTSTRSRVLHRARRPTPSATSATRATRATRWTPRSSRANTPSDVARFTPREGWMRSNTVGRRGRWNRRDTAIGSVAGGRVIFRTRRIRARPSRARESSRRRIRASDSDSVERLYNHQNHSIDRFARVTRSRDATIARADVRSRGRPRARELGRCVARERRARARVARESER